MLNKGHSIPEIKKFAYDYIADTPQFIIEYFELVNTQNFTIIEKIEEKSETALCISGYLNNIRLIDNVFYI